MDAAAAAEWVGIAVTLGIAIVGWKRSNRVAAGAREHADAAEARAKRAEQRAERAVELAESAEARADRLERRAAERRDVAWTQRWLEQSATLSFRNVGTDPAYDVELNVYPAGEDHFRRQTVSMREIGPDEPIGIQLGVILQDATQGGWFPTVIDQMRKVHVRARLTWRSAEGVHDKREWPDLLL